MTNRQIIWSTAEFVILALVCIVCLTRGRLNVAGTKAKKKALHVKHANGLVRRRNSDIGTVGHVVPSTPLKKQTSEDNLTSPGKKPLVIIPPIDPLLYCDPFREVTRKKKRKKKSLLFKSSSDSIKDETNRSTQMNERAGLLFSSETAHKMADSENLDDRRLPLFGSTSSLPCNTKGSDHARPAPPCYANICDSRTVPISEAIPDAVLMSKPTKRKSTTGLLTVGFDAAPVTNGFSQAVPAQTKSVYVKSLPEAPCYEKKKNPFALKAKIKGANPIGRLGFK